MVRVFMGVMIVGSIGFGISAMTLMIDLRPASMPKTKRLLFFMSVFAVILMNFFISVKFGVHTQTKYYMLLVHLPLTVLFWFITKIHPIKILFTLFTAVFLSFPCSFIASMLARYLVHSFYFLVVVAFSVAVATLFVINKCIKKNVQYLIQHYDSRSFIKLFLLPVVYNAAAYWIGKYDYTLSVTTNNLIIRFMLFAVTLTAYLLVFDISRTDKEKHLLKYDQTVISLQLESASRQMVLLRNAQEQTKIYRHDMRHHISLLSNIAAEGNLQKIKEYLSVIETDIDAITPIRYCENEIANLILTSFDIRAREEGVALCTYIELPGELGINDTELCSLLSNALENAIAAAAKVNEEELRKVYIRVLEENKKLLVSIKNNYVGHLEMDGRLPKSQNRESGHGFGVRSMVSIVERYGGLYSFETVGNVFTLQLMLPLKSGCKPVAR